MSERPENKMAPGDQATTNQISEQVSKLSREGGYDQRTWVDGLNSEKGRQEQIAAGQNGNREFFKGEEALANGIGNWLGSALKHFIPNGEATIKQLKEAFISGQFPDGTPMKQSDAVRANQTIQFFNRIAEMSGTQSGGNPKITMAGGEALRAVEELPKNGTGKGRVENFLLELGDMFPKVHSPKDK